MSETKQKINLACDLGALNTTEREHYAQLHRQLNSAIVKVDELPEGYELQCNYDPSLFMRIAELVTLEHLCCPFLQLVLKIESGDGSIRLQLAGAEGVKAFLRAELGF